MLAAQDRPKLQSSRRAPKLHVVTLGCQMSAADGAELAAPLAARGFGWAAAPEDADAIVISTCTVRQHAEDRALSLIGSLRPWKEQDPRRVLIVAGCAAERLKGWLEKRFPYIDLVVGAKSMDESAHLVESALSTRFDALAEQAASFADSTKHPFPSPTESPATAYLTVMRGCNYSCSYCIVPSVRGRELYRPFDTVLDEAKRLVDRGAREIMLLGQTVNSWRDGDRRFADLLRALDAGTGVERLRFMSPHPFFVDDDMIEAMAECRSVCEQLHLPAQSGSDRLLKLMRRNYTRDGFLRKAELVRARHPRVVFSTDVIVGFPTETEADFERTLSLVKELAPASAYTFKYSPREGTESAERMADDVPEELKEERLARLNELVDRLTQDALKSQVGRTAQILIEQAGFGRTREGFNARFESAAAPGQLVSVRVTGTSRRTLLGETDER